jgi:membrane protein insertase Oxa1/YidC/SpoIIIJ
MVLSIRKISTENEDLTGAGMLWFKNLNEPDPYLLLPLIATVLNYFNLGVSDFWMLPVKYVERNNKGE